MDLPQQASASEGLLVFRFPKDSSVPDGSPEDFVPLRLVMRPGDICVELLESGLLLGRHTSADVRLSLPDMSRRHCRFLYTDGEWEVLYLNSMNGIYVNGERLQRS